MRTGTFFFAFLILIPLVDIYSQNTHEGCMSENRSLEQCERPIMNNYLISPSEAFKIHYTNEIDLTEAQTVALAADYALNKLCVEWGWRELIPDNQRGGDDKYDIYLSETTASCFRGVTEAEDCDNLTSQGKPSFIKLDLATTMQAEDFEILVAHELVHAVQIAYSKESVYSNLWFAENTAVFIADKIYEFEHNFYLKLYDDLNNCWGIGTENPIESCDRKINSLHSYYQYAGAIFPMFLEEWTGIGSLIRDIYYRCETTQETEIINAIDAELREYNTNFDGALRFYSEWRYFTGYRDDGNHFMHASLLPEAPIIAEHSSYPISLSQTGEAYGPGGTRYIGFNQSNNIAYINLQVFSQIENANLSLYEVKNSVINNNLLINLENLTGSIVGDLFTNDKLVLSHTTLSNVVNTVNYSASIQPIRAVLFKNEYNSADLGGTFILNNQIPISSNSSYLLAVSNVLNNIKTQNERFLFSIQGNSYTVKHNTWNSLQNEFKFNKDFKVFSSGDVNQIANFKDLDHVTIRSNINGNFFDDGLLIKFNDPWYLKDENGTQSDMNDFLEFPSPFNPTGSYNQATGGVFLNQNPNFLPNLPYYSVKAENEFSAYLTQTQKTHTFYFRGWGAAPSGSANFQYSSQLETPVVFLSENAVVSANYKGTQLSEDANAFQNNNQRKFIRTPDGYLHQVYESNGDIYYELKHEEDESWVFMNNGNRIGIGKNPSIDYCSYSYAPESMGEIVSCEVFIVFAEPSGNEQNIRLQRYRYNPSEENFYTLQQTLTVVSGNSTTNETIPLIAFHNDKISIVWKITYANTILYLARGTFSRENGITINGGKYLGNGGAAINYTIAASKERDTLHLAWEERSSGKESYGTIYYSTIPEPDAASITLTRNNISQYSGCYDNSYPSMIERGGGVRVVWRGLLNDEEQSDEKGMEESQTSVVVFKDPGYYYYWLFGNNVKKPVINQATTEPYYVFAWAEEDGTTNKFADNTLSTIRTASTTGKYLQLSGGEYKSDIYLNAHTENEGVKYFAQSENFTKLYKENNVPISKGRQGVVGIDSVQFYFVFGDIEVNGGKVDFEELSYTADISQNQVFNSYLRSEPFALNDNSEFSYSVIYGVSDSLGAVNVLSPNNKVSFKTELIDEETNEEIGTFDATEYGSGNVINYRNIAYEVNTEGIGNRTVRLRLVITPTSECNYTLGNRIAEWSAMGKSGKTKISYRGTDIPTEYALFQNYPNPFNPVTTITYQIPKEGLVTLKIYDILGKEVTTLLNEEKQAGKYSIEFNASRLSSGVYLYELRSNEYKSTKKLLLMK